MTGGKHFIRAEAQPPADPTDYGPRVPREFFAREPVLVAPDLVGTVLVRDTPDGAIAVRVTEVEAYHGEQDPASHAYRGRTARTAVMFGPPGFLYVYFVYGMHWCANVVTGVDGIASAVLLRAAEVIGGLDAARTLRRSPSGRIPADRALARGPATLARVLGLTGTQSGADLCSDQAPFRVHRGLSGQVTVGSGPRVGVAAAGDIHWRFYDLDSPTVSAYRAGGRRRHTGDR